MSPPMLALKGTSEEIDGLALRVRGRAFDVQLHAPIDLAIALDPHGRTPQPNAFLLPGARAEAALTPAPADTRLGASINCEIIQLCAHGNGTHTECVGHLTHERIALCDVLQGALFPATVLSVELLALGASGERYPGRHDLAEPVITRHMLERALRRLTLPYAGFSQALVLRTLPNTEDKRWAAWGGSSPPYLTLDAIEWVLDQGVEHLLVDLPSLDREDDGGTLPIHCRFWDLEPGTHRLSGPPSRKTVTELIYVPDDAMDGHYLLNLQAPSIASDAAPSRPLLFRLRTR